MGLWAQMGLGQANIPISLFIHSKTIGFSLLYRSFRYRKKPYMATGTPLEAFCLLPNTTADGKTAHLPFDSLDKRPAPGCNALCPTILSFCIIIKKFSLMAPMGDLPRSIRRPFNWGVPHMTRNVMPFHSRHSLSPIITILMPKR